MPTYEYACKSCSQSLEVVQSFSDDPLTECPACAGQLRKVFGNVGIAFKGSGFYKNDSRKSSSGSTSTTSSDKAETPAKPSDSGNSASPSSTETKPAKPAPATKSE